MRKKANHRVNFQAPAEERFFSYVAKQPGENGCWLWTGYIRPDGYGEFWSGKKKDKLAHRGSLQIHGLPLPEWPDVVDHLCKVKHCVNPAHLRVVPQAINTTENSNSYWAKNKAKTHCNKGHPLSGDNVAWKRKEYKTGWVGWHRHCLTCYPNYANYKSFIVGGDPRSSGFGHPN